MPSPAEFHYADFVENIPDLPEGEEFLIYGTVRAITIGIGLQYADKSRCTHIPSTQTP